MLVHVPTYTDAHTFAVILIYVIVLLNINLYWTFKYSYQNIEMNAAAFYYSCVMVA